MDAAHWERVQDVFHRSLALPEAERAAYLRTACGGDFALFEDVVALLGADASGNEVLNLDLAHLAHSVLGDDRLAVPSIGPYRVLRTLGEGGMGVVYLAEREDLAHRVAIKVLRDALLSPARRERFVREEQLLAQLNHPSIAALYDAGTLPDGTPYFVMEYVDGEPLTTYCATHALSTEERIRLFHQVCGVVQYAHLQAIVHRDLKPSNILIRSDGQVKLLDFGIAKQLEEISAAPAETQTGFRMMTPAYAAPEQIRGEAVGVYTDVYALGVILYQLLTGQVPFPASGLSPGEMEALILTGEPERPSARARTAAAEEPGSAGPRATRRAWRDLDVLCLTAMDKEVRRRYATVEALMRDLERYLEERPLEARPETLGYRSGKFLRRNLRGVTAAALIGVAAVGLSGYHTVRLTDARDAAVAEAARTQRIQRFMLGLFRDDESLGPSDSLRVVTLLERGVHEAEVLDAEPAIQAELYRNLGDIYVHLGRFARADSLLRSALAQSRALFGDDHPEVARSLIALGLLRTEQAEYEEAERLVRAGLDASRQSLAPRHPLIPEALTALGRVLQARGDYEAAIGALDEAVRLRARYSPGTAELSESLTELANTHFYAGGYKVADSLNRAVLALDQGLHGNRHPLVANSLINLGATRSQLGFYTDAEALYRQALKINQEHYGGDHHATAANLMMLGQALTYQGRLDEALEVLRPALLIRERVYGSDHPRVANTLNELGSVAQRQGDFVTAADHFRRMGDIYRSAFDDHYLIAIATSNLAGVYLDAGQPELAEPLFQDAVDGFSRTLSADHVNTAIARLKLGRSLLRQGRSDEALEHLLAGHRILSARANPSVRWLQAAREDLAAIHEQRGQPDRAAEYRAEIVAAAEEGGG